MKYIINKLFILIFVFVTLEANIMYKSHIDKKTFLEIDPSFYTINLATLYYYDDYKEFIQELNTQKDIFVFEFGDNEDALLTKILFGKFKTYKDALIMVTKLPERLKNNKPYINKIGEFQDLYKKYHNKKNTIIYPVDSKDISHYASKQSLTDNEERIAKITFADAFIEVMGTNPTILEQDIALKIAQNEKDDAFANFLPTVDYSYEDGKIYDAYDSTGATLKTGSKTQSLTANWNLFNGLQDYRYYKVINLKYKSTLLDRKDVIDTVLFEFIKAYIGFLKTKDIYEIGNKEIASYQDYIEKKKLKDKYGMISMSNRAAVTKKYITAQINHLETNQKRYYDALFGLQEYIDIDENTQVLITKDEANVNISEYNFNNIIKKTIDKNSKYLQSDIEVKLAQQNLQKEYKNFMPTIDLVAQKLETDITYTDRSEINNETSIKFKAKINLFKGGKDYILIKKKINEYKQKQEEQKSVMRKVKYNVKTAFNEYKSLEDKSLLLQKLLTAAKKAYKAAEYDLLYAKTDEDGLLSALESLHSIEKQNAELKYDLMISKYKLLYKIGTIQDKLSIQRKLEIN
ncbi:MAG: TolC family protein [Arcobacteraceae bacterium]|nr:TolC family protein [Arcobacteraceae bacterium]